MSARECGCDGSGRIPYVRDDSDLPPRGIGGGLSIGGGVMHGTHLCSCRWKLKERPGDARWWTTRTLLQRSTGFQMFDESADVTVEVEVPVSDDNFIVQTKGNRYYPTSVQLSLSSEDLNWLFPAEARELAAMLTYAADLAEAWDAADADHCGHWAPCDCARPKGAS